jgi:hypothetical protein
LEQSEHIGSGLSQVLVGTDLGKRDTVGEPIDGECAEGAGYVALVTAVVFGGRPDVPTVHTVRCHVVALVGCDVDHDTSSGRSEWATVEIKNAVELLGSWEGLQSRDVERGSAEVIFLVDWRFFCHIWRWPLLVASDLAKGLVMRDEVRPGQELKWPRCTARRKVEGRGLKAHAWRNAARSCLVWRFRIAPLAKRRGSGGGMLSCGGEEVLFGARGIFQRPLVVFRLPTIITCPFL